MNPISLFIGRSGKIRRRNVYDYMTTHLNIVLFQPEIPQNTGNIARTCVLTNSRLHLIHPLGFILDEKKLIRAGLDYWDQLDLEVYDCYAEFMEKHGDHRIYLASTRAVKRYDEVTYRDGDFIMFGRESSGVPAAVHDACEGIRVPMIESSDRSLNVSNTVSIVAYEALRQLGFPEMR